jgi:type 1 glutamine amidotransferase
MPVVRYGEPLNVLVAAKGHPYERDPFMALFDTLPGIACTLVEQPLAQRLMTPEGMAGFDVLVLYDMPGLDFMAADPPGYVEPSEAFKSGFLALLDTGVGVVALHHAIAGWPAWPQYAELLGGRFLYRSGPMRDRMRPDSGYRHEVRHTVSLADPDHPVLAGLPDQFDLTDELYLFEVFEDLVRPLLRSDHAFERDGFYSAAKAVQGQMYSNDGWAHEAGSNLVGWTKRAGDSPLVYLQPGDGPSTYADPHYKRLIENAIRWTASPEARHDMKERRQ